MQKRNTKERRQIILQTLNSKGKVSVEGLAGDLDTSEVTIRKDLRALEDAGLAVRRYGGAVALNPDGQDLDGSSGITKRKLEVSACASKLIKDHNRIIIDSGTTTQAMIPHLSRVRGLVVMTNSLNVANHLRELENEPTLLMTGGTWDTRSESFQGRLAQQMLAEYNFDQLFIGADGLDLTRGTTTYNEFTDLSKSMANAAREVIVVAESNKLKRKIPNLELSWSEVDYLVTDCELDPSDKQNIELHNVDVLCAGGLSTE